MWCRWWQLGVCETLISVKWDLWVGGGSRNWRFGQLELKAKLIGRQSSSVCLSPIVENWRNIESKLWVFEESRTKLEDLNGETWSSKFVDWSSKYTTTWEKLEKSGPSIHLEGIHLEMEKTFSNLEFHEDFSFFHWLSDSDWMIQRQVQNSLYPLRLSISRSIQKWLCFLLSIFSKTELEIGENSLDFIDNIESSKPVSLKTNLSHDKSNHSHYHNEV
jgi:hypothetical protein